MKKGKVVLFTGLSGAGKTTLAKAFSKDLDQKSQAYVFLDGDIIRTELCSDLGFTAEDRLTNLKRVSFVASQVAKVGGICLLAFIAPFADHRDLLKKQVEANGDFYEIYVSTPLEICEKRDVKGLYEKARSGLIKNFTGLDSPYEAPMQPDLTLDTSRMSLGDALALINKTIF